MSQLLVRVKGTSELNLVRVDGMNFSKHGATLINAAELTDEIRNSPLLEVEQVAESAAEPSPQAVDRETVPAEPVESGGSPASPAAKAPVQPRRGKPK